MFPKCVFKSMFPHGTETVAQKGIPMFFIAGSFIIKIKANPKDDMLAKEVFEI